MMMVSVRVAFFRVGSRKALTPFETASTPVMAVQPEEKTLASNHSVSIALIAGRCGGATTGTGLPCVAMTLYAPTPMVMSSVAMKKYVGIENAAPASLVPRMLTSVRMASTSRHSASRCGCRLGNAETRFSTPAEMPTAALRM